MFITTGNKRGQRSILFLSAFICFVFAFFLFFDYSTPMLFLFFISLLLSYYANYFFSKFYDVKIQDGMVSIENIWREDQYPLTELLDLRSFYFIFPYPFNPFIKFIFKNRSKVVTKLQSMHKIYLQKGDIELYLSELKKELEIK